MILPGAGFLYEKYPLVADASLADFDTAAAGMVRFLAKYGATKSLPLHEIDSCIRKTSVSCAGYRYLVTPCELRSATKEKKATVGTFVKLNQEGDFVPANTSRTITSSTTETTIRFVVLDLDSGTVVFNATIKAAITDNGAVETSGGKDTAVVDNAKARLQKSVLAVFDKLKARLPKSFEGYGCGEK